MRPVTEIAIIGAGPYGLSLASHLLARGIVVRIFGDPMQTWRESMPTGMKLKSEGFASNLSDPGRELTLEAHCSKHDIPYAHTGLPVKVETFVSYGEAFQKRFVPELERKMVNTVLPAPHGFDLILDDEEVVAARRVVVASGIRSFDYIPPEFRDLPSELLTHSVAFGDARYLSGRDVVVIGSGASAMDVAALLREREANVRVMTRRSAIHFQTPLGDRSVYEKVTAPMTPLGPGWKSVLCVRAPMVFHAMPEAFRVDVVRRYLGPGPAWFTREQIEGHVPYITESTLVEASAKHGRARLLIRRADGRTAEIFADHVVAATGYRVDVDRLVFLGERLRSSLKRVAGAPSLSRNFESTVPGLYFAGTATANCFGPMMRFAHGAGFTSYRLSRHLASRSRRQRAIAAEPLATREARSQQQLQ
jgi:cation diffusion facilitator CzcD-associated flavoprotein CzcO